MSYIVWCSDKFFASMIPRLASLRNFFSFDWIFACCRIVDCSYLVDRLAVGLGNKHGCYRVADNWVGDLLN